MKIRNPKRAMPLHQVPVAAVFGLLEDGRYTRFLKLGPDAPDGIPAVSLGPWVDPELPGPTAFLLDADTTAYLEEDTVISPKLTNSDGTPIEPSRSARVPLGALIIGNDGETYLQCRSRRGERAMLNLATGKARSPHPETAFYEHYVLIVENELGENFTAFDSAAENSVRAAA